jgi:hypothetical protein
MIFSPGAEVSFFFFLPMAFYSRSIRCDSGTTSYLYLPRPMRTFLGAGCVSFCRTPLQGYCLSAAIFPRASPWADIGRPFGAARRAQESTRSHILKYSLKYRLPRERACRFNHESLPNGRKQPSLRGASPRATRQSRVREALGSNRLPRCVRNDDKNVGFLSHSKAKSTDPKAGIHLPPCVPATVFWFPAFAGTTVFVNVLV